MNVLIKDHNSDRLSPFLQCTNLEQYVTSATHFTDHSATLIDLICGSTKIFNVTVNYIPDLSSHAYIVGELNMKKPKPIPKWISYRPLKDINLKEFDAQVEATSWERCICDVDVNMSLFCFNLYILNIFDNCAPIKVSYVKSQSYPWITETIKTMMKLRDEAHAKSRATKLEPDKLYYKQLKCVVNRALFSEKAVFFRKNLNANYKNSRELWKNVKLHVADFKSKKSSIPLNINNPDLINKNFLDTPGKDFVKISDLTYLEYHRFNTSMFSIQPVTELMVSKIIANFTTNATGVDGISRDMILLTLPRTLGVITSIVNQSIRTGVFPDVWKEALVKPIPKINNPQELKDFRPVSILPFLSKIIEKVICQQLMEYLDANNILPPNQSGFRTGRSTATALLDVIDDILAGVDKGDGTILVLLDFSRAFDTINHNLLMSKLAYYGLDSIALRWFSSYLSGRLQRVETSTDSGIVSQSVTSAVLRGVPQGSILGPILFLLYTADITHTIRDCRFHLYADDLQVYTTFNHNETPDAVCRLNQDLNRIAEWSDRNGLVLNPLKSKFMVLGSRNQVNLIKNHNPQVKVGNNNIVLVNEARNLGVVMDERLKFHTHVIEVTKNCFYRLKILYRVRNYLSETLRIYLCETLILSKLNYADTIMGECLLSNTKRLIQRVQNACARFCFSIPSRAHVTPYLNNGNLLNMASRLSLHFACLLFGVVKTGTPEYLFDKISFSQRLVRTASRLIVPQHKTSAFRGSFRYAATKCWNNIPPPVRNCTSFWSFKNMYRKHLECQQKSSSILSL